MIDKKLSNLKNDIPEYNIAEYKKGVFKKYNESKSIYKKESLFPLKYFLSPLLIVLIATLTIVIIINNNGNRVNAYEEDRKLLTQLVYNASIQANEEYEVSKISKNKKFSNDLYYTSFTIHESFGFTTTFDFVMEPYINDYIIGEEVFVVIALLEFSNEQFYGDAFLQKMIVFSYKDSLVGFMSPVTSSVLMGDFNEVEKLDDSTIDTLYTFQSCTFLTKNAVVKYYEKDDTLYTFEFLEYKNGAIELLIDCNKGECDSNIINDSFIELSEDIVIKLIELTYIEKININVTITGFDEEDKNKIYVESNEISTIESVNYRYAILDANDNILNFNKLNVGDVIKVYYYNRYETYQPKNITVDNIILIQDNNQENIEGINGEYTIELIASNGGLIWRLDSLKIEDDILYLNYPYSSEEKVGKFEIVSDQPTILSAMYDIDEFNYKTEEAKEIVKELFNSDSYYTIYIMSIPEYVPGYILISLNNKLYYIKTLSQTFSGNSVAVYELTRK